MKLRPYQQEFTSAIYGELATNRKVICCAPTGFGKTVVFSKIAKDSLAAGHKVLVVTDRKELLTQTSGSFSRVGLSPEEITAKTKSIKASSCYVAMSETLKRRVTKKEYIELLQTFTMVIVDEAHKQSFDKLYKFLNPSVYLLGFTATPHRTGSKTTPLSSHFGNIVMGKDIAWLVENGYLATPTTYGIPVDGLDDIKQTRGDFDTKEMSSLYDSPQLYSGVVKNYKLRTPDTKTLAFTPNIATSDSLADEFNANGISARSLSSNTPDDIRTQILKDFDNDKFKVLVNCSILTTGFDAPSIETIIMYRATRSLTLWLQCIGRGSRTTETKDSFTLMDFGDNVKRLGFWEQPGVWSLDIKTKPKAKADLAAAKECPSCHALVAPSVKVCPHCSHVFELPKDPVEVLLEELKYRDPVGHAVMTYIAKAKAMGYHKFWAARQCSSFLELQKFGELSGYKAGWCHVNRDRYGL